MQPTIKTYGIAQLNELLAGYGQPVFRVKQLLEWLYPKQAGGFEEMSNLPRDLRERLANEFSVAGIAADERLVSADGTRKYLFRLHDGACIETVGIPSDDDGRLTVCFSTQVGCPMQCAFCATGQEGFVRNLGMGEMVDQVLAVQNDFGRRVTNLVAMGQGEPFLNLDAVLDALSVLNNPKGIAIGARKITVSTCGIIHGIQAFSQVKQQFTLAVSLHAARQDVRNHLMPKTAAYPLDKLRAALLAYVAETNRRVTLEYIMIRGVNDSDEDLEALLAFCEGLLCHINFIPINAVDNLSFKPSTNETIRKWLLTCENAHIEATLRSSRGSDINGACGQLKQVRKGIG